MANQISQRRPSVGVVPCVVFPQATSRSQDLLALVGTLATFDDVIRWDECVKAEVEDIHRYLAGISLARERLDAATASSKAERGELPFLRRLLAGLRSWMSAFRQRRTLNEAERALPHLIAQLESSTGTVPHTKSEQKEMIADLREIKKELNLKKKELNQAMREARTEARRRNTGVGTGLSALFSTPAGRRFDRTMIRLDKESALGRHEGPRDMIERQVIAVEREIIRIERFR